MKSDIVIDWPGITKALAEKQGLTTALKEAKKMAHPTGIVRIKRDPEKIKGRWYEFYSVPSHSDPKSTYVVATDKTGQLWGCSCPRWIYRREDCKHIQQVRALLASQTVEEAHPDTLSEKTRKALDRIGRLEIAAEPLQITDDGPDSNRAGYLEV